MNISTILFRMRYLHVCVAAICVVNVHAAQNIITAEGTGPTREKAITNAILAANEQISGVFCNDPLKSCSGHNSERKMT